MFNLLNLIILSSGRNLHGNSPLFHEKASRSLLTKHIKSSIISKKSHPSQKGSRSFNRVDCFSK